MTKGGIRGHEWSDATCSSRPTCMICGEVSGSALSHRWVGATCTTPQTCTLCGQTAGQPMGHNIYVTNCRNLGCDYADFSKYARSYSDDNIEINGWNGNPYTVTNVNLSTSGIFSFTFNEKNYSLEVYQSPCGSYFPGYVSFYCYQNDVEIEDATFFINPNTNELKLKWDYMDGYDIIIHVYP